MKSLQESLFDSNLVSKDTGYEYLYGIITQAGVHSNYRVNYLDEKKIKRDFNTVMKKFRPQQWSNNAITGMNVYQKMEMNELLRELLYIVVCNIKYSDIPFKSGDEIDGYKLGKIIKNIIDNYVDSKFSEYVSVTTFAHTPGVCSIRIYFSPYNSYNYDTRTGDTCVIRAEVDSTILK